MRSLTEVIETHIIDLLERNKEDTVSLRRKELAEQFGCVPSQINYVLRSRFTPERGYLVESQRGGHGYIRILRICYEMPEERVGHIDELVGDSITEQEARRLLISLQSRGFVDARERLLIEVALRHIDDVGESTFDVSPYKRNVLQAELLKRMLRGLVFS
ncbi:CtsR family transcriptional regulator [Dethiosulfovibrio salsuginis]|uniref:Transcriptional regulator CtsR n=1 Tax=Dethiosulfovibrio salsuginis TaxID=561720 RepID=A0A1X7KML5_9BACT|nr:CtsR family transcriptional regulator [Dethiosulfovibrio salsuginis]SMG42323.1 transcriptional regulator CtsR [Dethiosulfovibrio salsuginis]